MLMQKLRKNVGNRKGFTLVELLVVVAILGILAALVVPKFTSSTESAKKAKIKADLRTIDSANAIYNANNGVDATDVAALVTAGLLASTPKPPKTWNATGTITGDTGDDYAITSGRATITVGGAAKNADALQNW